MGLDISISMGSDRHGHKITHGDGGEHDNAHGDGGKNGLGVAIGVGIAIGLGLGIRIANWTRLRGLLDRTRGTVSTMY